MGRLKDPTGTRPLSVDLEEGRYTGAKGPWSPFIYGATNDTLPETPRLSFEDSDDLELIVGTSTVR